MECGEYGRYEKVKAKQKLEAVRKLKSERAETQLMEYNLK